MFSSKVSGNVNFMYLSILLPYEEYIDGYERIRVFWIMVNIMKYD